MMEVTPYEAGRFHVVSDDPKRRGKKYLVDMMERGGRGQCDCENFRIEVTYKARQEDCKHIRRVIFWLGERVVKEWTKGNQ